MTSANPLNVVETNQLPTRRGTDSNSYEARVMASGCLNRNKISRSARNMDRRDISNRLREANDAYPAPLITWDEKLIEERKLTDELIRRRQARL
jgi:hypothetical protein